MKFHPIPALLSLVLAGLATGKTIPNHAIADRVLGQSDFVSDLAPTPPNSFSLNSPSGVAIDPVSRKVFVSDYNNSRVLRYPNVNALTNGAGAEAVFGQARFSTGSAATGELRMSFPHGLCLDRLGRLWVADAGNNRVLMFEAAIYRDTQAYPDRVYGQPDFTTNTAAASAIKMANPTGVWVDAGDRLWVAELGNNRVLRFDSITTKSNGAAANGVLGQALFTTSAAGSGSSGFQAPLGVAVSATGTLFVNCGNSHRVLGFNNAASLGDGAGASTVLGQADFTSTAAGLSATRMNSPFGIWITPDDSLWVGEFLNNRCLRFDKASTKPSGAAADGVVGQPDFTTNTINLSNRGLNRPIYQPCVDATGSLWVPDFNNSRVVRFSPDVTRPLLALTGTVPKSTSRKQLLIKGTASDTYGISKVKYRIGTGSLKTASGTTSWQFTAPLAMGKNAITIVAVDSVGNNSIRKVLKVTRVAK